MKGIALFNVDKARSINNTLWAGVRVVFGAAFLPASIAIIACSQANAQALYSIGSPTNYQQYMLELINRARANGGAEATRLGLSGLQEGPPNVNGEPWTIQNSVQPLSWNSLLRNAAQGHSDRLNNADQFFLGVSPHTFGGMTPSQRIAAAGYSSAPYNGPTTPAGYFPGNENVWEEVSQGSGPYTGARLTAAILQAHNELFTDQGVPGRGHRNTIMLAFFREIGIGITTGTDNQANPGQPNGPFDSIYIVQNFATDSNQKPFITGVVYRDANGNNFYDPSEGIGGVRVDVTNTTFYAVTASSGGYSVPVAGNGSYTVTFSGGSLPTVQKSATVANGLNVKVDYLAGEKEMPTGPVATADFNGDGSTDYLLFNPSTRRTAIWYLQGNAFLSGAYGPTLPAGWAVAGVADFNLDTKPDYVLFNASTRQTAVWYLSNATFLSGAYGPTLPAGWTLIAAADFNNNGRPDYVLFNPSTRQTAIWYLNGTTFSVGAYGPTLPAAWTLIATADFNNNGRPDYVLFNPSTRQTAIWYLNGTTFSVGAYGPTLPAAWTLQGAADFNANAKPDYLLFQASTRQTAIWYLNGTAFAGSAYGPTLPAGY
jgi:uncharacterized protein YkwD